MDKNYEYHEDLDILYVFNNPNNEKSSYNLVRGNIVIDFSQNGEVIGVEIDCPSRFFDLSYEQLLNLKEARIQLINSGDMSSIGVFLSTESKEHRFQFDLPKKDKTENIVVNH
jgi:uncharacterized protein YuzE